jgi:uncharacterized membrane protein
MTWIYDPASIPQGVEEENLVVARWNATTGKWVELRGKVDLVNHTIIVEINGFSSYAIIAHNRSASFTVSDLIISPTQIEEGQSVEISVTIKNTGDLTANYSLIMHVNNSPFGKRQVLLTGGESVNIHFTVNNTIPGTNTVDVNGIAGSFIVKPVELTKFSFRQLRITPNLIILGESLYITVQITNDSNYSSTKIVDLIIDGNVYSNQQVSLGVGESRDIRFEITPLTLGEYNVDIGELKGSFIVEDIKSVKTETINWWIVGGIITAILIITTLSWFFIKRAKK